MTKLAIKILLLIECLLLLMMRFIKRPWERNINWLIKVPRIKGGSECLQPHFIEKKCCNLFHFINKCLHVGNISFVVEIPLLTEIFYVYVSCLLWIWKPYEHFHVISFQDIVMKTSLCLDNSYLCLNIFCIFEKHWCSNVTVEKVFICQCDMLRWWRGSTVIKQHRPSLSRL